MGGAGALGHGAGELSARPRDHPADCWRAPKRELALLFHRRARGGRGLGRLFLCLILPAPRVAAERREPQKSDPERSRELRLRTSFPSSLRLLTFRLARSATERRLQMRPRLQEPGKVKTCSASGFLRDISRRSESAHRRASELTRAAPGNLGVEMGTAPAATRSGWGAGWGRWCPSCRRRLPSRADRWCARALRRRARRLDRSRACG